MANSNKSSSSNDTRPARQRRKDARPGELLNAAITVFAHTGFHMASMEEIGARAGVSKGTVYLYFGTKESLFAEAVRHGAEALLERSERAVAEEQGSAPAMLRRLVSAWDATATGQPAGALLRLLLVESSTLPTAKRYAEVLFERMHGLIQTQVERGIAEGHFQSCNSSIVARIVCAALWGHAVGRRPGEPARGPSANELYAHIDLVLRGLANV